MGKLTEKLSIEHEYGEPVFCDDASVTESGETEYYWIREGKKVPLTLNDFKELGWVN